jgi:hypothetical protein
MKMVRMMIEEVHIIDRGFDPEYPMCGFEDLKVKFAKTLFFYNSWFYAEGEEVQIFDSADERFNFSLIAGIGDNDMSQRITIIRDMSEDKTIEYVVCDECRKMAHKWSIGVYTETEFRRIYRPRSTGGISEVISK